ncbi:MAG: hypothetical protein UHL70_03670 [Acutalibacteraceae bacterium]|nr:hypothetical protein [Acutalibacteraceae bacterium]
MTDIKNNILFTLKREVIEMVCKKCGTSYEGNFCPNCGTPSEKSGEERNGYVEQMPSQNNYLDNMKSTLAETQTPTKKKKPIYIKWWFWVIIAVLALLIISGIGSNGENDSDTVNSNDEYVESVDETTEETTTEKITTTKPTTTVPKLSESEFKAQCSTIDFDTIARNPDKYKGKKYKFTGEVIQVSETSLLGTTFCGLRIDVTQGEYGWEDTIYATVTIKEGEDRILEDDIITIWGTCEGNYTYTSVMGASISLPKIDVEYFEIS